MEELKPCPFCGSNIVEAVYEDPDPHGRHFAFVRCENCRADGPYGVGHSKVGAIEDAEGEWNRRDGRTCRNVYEERVHPMVQCNNGFMCSECGETVQDCEHYEVTGAWNYCPGCVARVVGWSGRNPEGKEAGRG